MERTTSRSSRRRGSALLALALTLSALGLGWLGRDRSGALAAQLPGVRAVHVEVEPDRGDGYLRRTVQLRSEDGIPLRLRVVSPHRRSGRLPAVLILGGHRSGADAVDLIPEPGELFVAALDDPYFGDQRPSGLLASLATLSEVRRGAQRTPTAAAASLAWLRSQADVDPDRLELVGASLGAPFALPTAALDARLARVWILQGGANFPRWLDVNLESRLPFRPLRAGLAWLGLQLIGARTFDAARIPQRAPTVPYIVVGSRDDERVPPECVAALVSALRRSHAEVEVQWTDSLHFAPGRPEVVVDMFTRVRARIMAR